MPQSSGITGGSGGGGSGGSAPDSADVPRDNYDAFYNIVVQYLSGMNNTSLHELTAPMLKPALGGSFAGILLPYTMLAVMAVAGNLALLYYVIRHRLYRDVTHALLTNLSLAHLVQVAGTMPMTMLVIMTSNWTYGQFMCFFTPLLQDIPVHVSLLSHLLIAYDRQRWLKDPTTGRLPSFVCCFGTWLTGMIIALPFPIYTTYIELGRYISKLRGVGICISNLSDDMNDYMRGIFLITFLLPCGLICYLYRKTARELRSPEAATLGGLTTSRQRTSSNTPSATRTGTQKNCVRSIDLYDTDMDGTRERRTQNYLCGMGLTQIGCFSPLMILKLGRMFLVETYENSVYFDWLYLATMWVAFLPAALNPLIYACWVLSAPLKARLRGYFRLSGRSGCDPPPACAAGQEAEMSTTTSSAVQAATTTNNNGHLETTNESLANSKAHRDSSASSSSLLSLLNPKARAGKYPRQPAFVRSTEVRPVPMCAPAADRDRRGSNYSGDPLLNSCSDITVTTPLAAAGAAMPAHLQAGRQPRAVPNCYIATPATPGRRANGKPPPQQLNSGSLYSVSTNSSSSSGSGGGKSVPMPLPLRKASVAADPEVEYATIRGQPVPVAWPAVNGGGYGGGYGGGGGGASKMSMLTENSRRRRSAPRAMDSADSEEADYAGSRCDSVSTYTNELDIEELERRCGFGSQSVYGGQQQQQQQQQHHQQQQLQLQRVVYEVEEETEDEGRGGSGVGGGSGGGRRGMGRQSSVVTDRSPNMGLTTGRRLPSLTRVQSTVESPLKSSPIRETAYFPNQVFTHQRLGEAATATAAAASTYGSASARLSNSSHLHQPPLPPAHVSPLHPSTGHGSVHHSMTQFASRQRMSALQAAVAAQGIAQLNGRITNRSTSLPAAESAQNHADDLDAIVPVFHSLGSKKPQHHHSAAATASTAALLAGSGAAANRRASQAFLAHASSAKTLMAPLREAKGAAGDSAAVIAQDEVRAVIELRRQGSLSSAHEGSNGPQLGGLSRKLHSSSGAGGLGAASEYRLRDATPFEVKL